MESVSKCISSLHYRRQNGPKWSFFWRTHSLILAYSWSFYLQFHNLWFKISWRYLLWITKETCILFSFFQLKIVYMFSRCTTTWTWASTTQVRLVKRGLRAWCSTHQCTVSRRRTRRRHSSQVSISPAFYTRLFCTKVLRKAFLHIHFRFGLFRRKNNGANALIMCWWNWPQVSLGFEN